MLDILKLYKKDKDDRLRYAEYWIDGDKATIHFGEVGKKGEVEDVDYLKDFTSEVAFMAYFKNRFMSQGFYKIHEQDCFWLAVQFPIKSVKGNQRDSWLKQKVYDVLNEELGWTGLGNVDGFDTGQTANPQKSFAINIYCIVVDEVLGIAAIKRALREYRLDYTRVKIASRSFNDDAVYTLKYSAKKNDLDFYI